MYSNLFIPQKDIFSDIAAVAIIYSLNYFLCIFLKKDISC